MQVNKKEQQLQTEEFKKYLLVKRNKSSREIMRNVNIIDYSKLKEKRKYSLDSTQQTLQMVQWEDQFSNMSPKEIKRVRETLQSIVGEEIKRNGSSFENMVNADTRKCLAKEIETDSIKYIEKEIKETSQSINSWGGQKYIDNIIGTMGILPSQ